MAPYQVPWSAFINNQRFVAAAGATGGTSGSAGVCARSNEVQTQMHENMATSVCEDGNFLFDGNPYPGPIVAKSHVPSIGIIRQSIHRNGASGSVPAICHDCGNLYKWVEYPTLSANSLRCRSL